MARPRWLLALPPLYFARRRRWGAALLHTVGWAFFLVFLPSVVGFAWPDALGPWFVLLAVVWGLSVLHALFDTGRRPLPASALHRGREGLMLLGVFASMIIAGPVLADRHAARARDAARIQDALWEAEWIVEQAGLYQAIEARAPASVAELRRNIPSTGIEAADSWGRDWVISATDDLWVCSRGPVGTGQCPPGDLDDSGRAASGSIGYATRHGGWSGAGSMSEVVVDALAVALFVGSPIAYVGYRVVRRLRGRPAPILSGGLAVLAFLLIVSVPSAVLLVLRSSVEVRARQAIAEAGACAIATAIGDYRVQIGVLPAALADLSSTATNAAGMTCGPFIEKLPAPLGRGAFVYKQGLGGTFTIRYRDPDFSAVAVCRR